MLRNIIDKALNGIGLQRKGVSLSPDVLTGTSQFILWGPGKKLDAGTALSLNKGWVYACVRAIAEEVAKIEFRMFEVGADGDIEVFDNDLLNLLDGINPNQTRFEVLYTLAAHLELVGNAYWLLMGKNGEPVKSAEEKPTAIYPLNPKYLKPIKATLPEFIKGFEYRMDGKVQTLETYQVVHFKTPDPADPFEGIGTVNALLEWIQADNSAAEFNAAFFRNGAKIGGALESERVMTVDQQKLLRATFEDLYKGADKAYTVAILPHGIKYTPLGDGIKDMDFPNLSEVLRDKILAGFRVSKTILGTAESDTNRATAETADYVFAERTVKPKMELIVQQLNEFLVPRFGDKYYLDFKSPTPEDLQAKMQELTAALPGQPSMSVNEAREIFFGLPPIANGDAVMGPIMNVPIGAPEPDKAKAAREQRIKSSTKSRRPTVSKFARNAQTRKSMAADIAKGIADALKKTETQLAEIKTKAAENAGTLSTMDETAFEIVYRAFFTRVTSYEKLLRDAVISFNTQQRDDVLKRLPDIWPHQKLATAGDGSATAAELLGGSDWPSVLVTLAEPSLSDLYVKEGEQAASLIGTSFAMTEEAKAALKRAIQLMSDSYNATTLDLLSNAIADGLKDGLGFDDMAAKIQNVYEFNDSVRAMQVARTETFRVANESTRTAWKQSGVVKSLKWYTAADERVCPWCEPMNGKTIGIDESFYQKGDTVQGSDGQTMTVDYDNVQAPPLHVSCRCYIRPEDISLT